MGFDLKCAKAIGLNPAEIAVMRRLKSPEAIQDFVTAMPINGEPEGDTCHSVRTALRLNCCHCIEATFIACCALMLHGQSALLMDFVAKGDDDHVVALFKRDGHWGAISKSNSVWLRWRDPIYRTPRELAMSYFHEYVSKDSKTLRAHSRPFNIGRIAPTLWITNDDNCWDLANKLVAIPHIPLISKAQAQRLRKRDSFEVKAGAMREFED